MTAGSPKYTTAPVVSTHAVPVRVSASEPPVLAESLRKSAAPVSETVAQVSDLRSVPARAPVLVLAVGNLLLGDDAAGLRLAQELSEQSGAGTPACRVDTRVEASAQDVEIQDGGTQGLALLPWLADREAVIILDAVSLGAPPGAVHILRGEDLGRLRARRATSAHEGNALELLETARLLGEHTGEVIVIGIEPEFVRTGIGLTAVVEAAIPQAMRELNKILGQWREERGNHVLGNSGQDSRSQRN